MPNVANVEVCTQEDTIQRYTFSNAILNVVIYDPIEEQNFYWVDITSTYPDYSRCQAEGDSIIWTDEGFERTPFDTIVCEDEALPHFPIGVNLSINLFPYPRPVQRLRG